MDRVSNGQVTDTEFLLELSSGQRSGTMGVQDFIGNLRTIKEKMEEDNEKLQREWEDMKRQRILLLKKEKKNGSSQNVASRKNDVEQGDEGREENESVRRNDSEETRKENGVLVGSAQFLGGGDPTIGSRGPHRAAPPQADHNKAADLGHLEAENEKLKREFQSMKAELAGIEKTNGDNRVSIIEKSPTITIHSNSSNCGKTNKYKTMLHLASESSCIDDDDDDDDEEQRSKGGYLQDKYAIDECFTGEAEEEDYSVEEGSTSFESGTTSSSMTSGRRTVSGPLEKQKDGALNRNGAYKMVFSRLKEARARPLYEEDADDDDQEEDDHDDDHHEDDDDDEEEEEEEEENSPRQHQDALDKSNATRQGVDTSEGDVFFDAVDANLARQCDLDAAQQQVQSLGMEMEMLRAMGKAKVEEMKKQQQQQDSTIETLKDQLEIIVAREGQLRVELAKAREQGDIAEQQLKEYQHQSYEHQAVVGRMEELRAINMKLEKKEQRLHQELEGSKFQATRQKHAIAALERQLGVASGAENASQQSFDPENPARDDCDETASQHQMMILDATLDRLRAVEEENGDLREVNRDLSQTKDLLAQVRETMQRTLEQQNENQASLQRQLEGSQTEVARLKIELNVAKEEADSLRKDLEEAKKASKDLEEARNRINEIEQEKEELQAKHEQERAELLKQAQEGQTLAALLKAQLDEAKVHESNLEKDIAMSKKDIQNVRNELNAKTTQLVEVKAELSEHQAELANALEQIGALVDDNTELRTINCQVEEALLNQSEEDQHAMRDLEEQLKDTDTREGDLIKALEKSRNVAEHFRRELEEAEERAREREERMVRQLKSLKCTNEDLETENVQLCEELSKAETDAKENRAKAQQLEKTACRTRQEKETVQTKLNELAYRLQKEGKSHQVEIAEANKRIWELEDEMDSQKEDMHRRCKKIERRAIRDSKKCGVPFL